MYPQSIRTENDQAALHTVFRQHLQNARSSSRKFLSKNSQTMHSSQYFSTKNSLHLHGRSTRARMYTFPRTYGTRCLLKRVEPASTVLCGKQFVQSTRWWVSRALLVHAIKKNISGQRFWFVAMHTLNCCLTTTNPPLGVHFLLPFRKHLSRWFMGAHVKERQWHQTIGLHLAHHHSNSSSAWDGDFSSLGTWAVEIWCYFRKWSQNCNYHGTGAELFGFSLFFFLAGSIIVLEPFWKAIPRIKVICARNPIIREDF